MAELKEALDMLNKAKWEAETSGGEDGVKEMAEEENEVSSFFRCAENVPHVNIEAGAWREEVCQSSQPAWEAALHDQIGNPTFTATHHIQNVDKDSYYLAPQTDPSFIPLSAQNSGQLQFSQSPATLHENLRYKVVNATFDLS